MKRREALSRVALLMGGALSAPSIAALVQGCTTTSESSAPFSLTPDLQDIVAQISDIIIPPTGTPGAKEVGCGPFIEMMIKDCYSDAQGARFKEGLEEVAKLAKEKGGSFTSLAEGDQVEIVKAMEAAAKKENEEEKVKVIDPETGKEKKEEAAKEPTAPFFTLMKELTLFGYFTSEVGMTEERDYIPIPGRYEGCIPLKEGQKAYAL
ncbi:gluconate 2-dehydrogenase subunit 3 family protein [Marinilongibacter aquaticus]|uniref:gluconate 2-dehydrogenase subunit 3 family protein n=1 Tax=Marinilongibacter aquaticus TaxID=2975157 RepID=UPI0021BD4FDE|nr:gluconate 2-dehydrogenase subunit 3 family protein [Marinilongibacter aquaticus]UBM58993.1 gluconate 2-dehydrogenase subunit 3 family protein [Marinilongibacter aquaticus]